jgi:hypothetical protein
VKGDKGFSLKALSLAVAKRGRRAQYRARVFSARNDLPSANSGGCYDFYNGTHEEPNDSRGDISELSRCLQAMH